MHPLAQVTSVEAFSQRLSSTQPLIAGLVEKPLYAKRVTPGVLAQSGVLQYSVEGVTPPGLYSEGWRLEAGLRQKQVSETFFSCSTRTNMPAVVILLSNLITLDIFELQARQEVWC